MPGRVLHLLSQRPSRTGSGVTLEAMVRQAAAEGWDQAVVIGVPRDDSTPTVGALGSEAIHPLRFGDVDNHTASDAPRQNILDFPVPGMSDVMPYRSTIWSTMTPAQLERYRGAWRMHLERVIADFAPDLIHTHHIWLMSSLIKEIAPRIPVVATCHSTGLRQMKLTPHLAAEVRQGCARIDHFCVLRADHGRMLQDSLAVGPERIAVVGAGYRPDLFHFDTQATSRPDHLLYIGKYSHAKGLPWLLDAFARLTVARPTIRLHVAGSGAGPEAEALRDRMLAMSDTVVLHGQLAQPELAALMKQCGVCVLPSFYEGVPLVLVEAAASGCQLVSTALPGVLERIEPQLAERLDLVPLPRLAGVDQPLDADLPRFVDDLADTLDRVLKRNRRASAPTSGALAPFTWEAVFARVQDVWGRLTTCHH